MTVWARGARALKAFFSFPLSSLCFLSLPQWGVFVQYDMGYRTHMVRVCVCMHMCIEQTQPSVIVRTCGCVQKTLL